MEEVGHLERGEITRSVNGEIRQQGDIRDMIWSVAEVISSLSSFLNCVQETYFYGTPAGVDPLECGDILEGEVGNLAKLNITIV